MSDDSDADDSANATERVERMGFGRVPIEITISVGKARPLLRDLLAMGDDAVLPLDRAIDDPVELYIGERLIARGELEEMEGDAEGSLGVRLTEVVDLKDGL